MSCALIVFRFTWHIELMAITQYWRKLTFREIPSPGSVDNSGICNALWPCDPCGAVGLLPHVGSCNALCPCDPRGVVGLVPHVGFCNALCPFDPCGVVGLVPH